MPKIGTFLLVQVFLNWTLLSCSTTLRQFLNFTRKLILWFVSQIHIYYECNFQSHMKGAGSFKGYSSCVGFVVFPYDGKWTLLVDDLSPPKMDHEATLSIRNSSEWQRLTNIDDRSIVIMKGAWTDPKQKASDFPLPRQWRQPWLSVSLPSASLVWLESRPGNT